MNERIESLMYLAGLTAQGCWDELGAYEREAIKKFAESIVQECASIALKSGSVSNKSEVAVAEADRIYHKIQEHFGVEE